MELSGSKGISPNAVCIPTHLGCDKFGLMATMLFPSLQKFLARLSRNMYSFLFFASLHGSIVKNHRNKTKHKQTKITLGDRYILMSHSVIYLPVLELTTPLFLQQVPL